MQSSLDKTAKIEEYYSNQDSELWTAGTATNGTVSSKEFLEIQSALSQPVKDALAKYGQPDFIRLVKAQHVASDDGWGDLAKQFKKTGIPLYHIALLYHHDANLIVIINQQNDKVWVQDFNEQEKRIMALMDDDPTVGERGARPHRLTKDDMRKDSKFRIHLDDPAAANWVRTGPVELFDVYYQRQVEKNKIKEQIRIKQADEAKIATQKAERERRDRLPPDHELRNMLIGYWEYTTEEGAGEYSVSETSIIKYKTNQTFTVKGKIRALGQVTKAVYDGTWDVKDGKICRKVKAVAIAGHINVQTPIGLMPQACIKEGEDSEDTIRNITTSRVEMLKEKNQAQKKILSRLKIAPADTSKPDIQKVNVLKDKAEKLKKKTFVFKAFYLGMPIEDAASLVAYYLGDISTSACCLSIEKTVQGKWFRDEGSGLRVEANNEGQVFAIYLPRGAVDKLFDAKDVELKSFIRTFQSAYDLPDFRYDCPSREYFSDNDSAEKQEGIKLIASSFGVQEKWTATSDKGYSITVYGDVTILNMEFALRMGALETIPSGSILVRKINTAAFD
jgi:hypothetical protein